MPTKSTLLPIIAVLAAAVGLALMFAPGLAAPTSSVTAGYKYYVPGYATATSEPTTLGIKVPSAIHVVISGDQRSFWATFNSGMSLSSFEKDVAVGEFNITKDPNIHAIRLQITLTDANLLKQYFSYFRLYIVEVKTTEKSSNNNNNGKSNTNIVITSFTVKAILTLNKPSEVITLDTSDFGNGNTVTLYIVPAYKVKDKAVFDQVPVDLKITVLGVA